jgi:alkylation response protein AidB-like acyl-CoA dehydrogenase
MSGAGAKLLAEIEALAPALSARAAEIEAGRTLPQDLVEALKKIGCFRMFVPKSHGGLELAVPDALEVVTRLTAIDGSVGWTVMIGCSSPIIYSRLPRKTFDLIYAPGPDVIQAGAVHAAGTAEIVDGGYRVSGRWAFASGCLHAEWLVGGCRITKNGAPVLGPSGQPLEKLVTLPARDWTIEDTWHAAGLKGTGSHHIRLTDAFVPAENAFDLVTDRSCLEGTLYQSVGPIVPLWHAAFALGVAEGARADLIALAGQGHHQFRARLAMRDQPTFQYELGRIDADVRAAAAYFESSTARMWALAEAHKLGEPAHFIETQQMAIWVTALCTEAVERCYTLAGGAAVYDTASLQRRLRDIHTGKQHTMVHPRHYATAGALSLGSPALPWSA